MAALESPTLLAKLERVERYLNSATVCFLCNSPKLYSLKHACQMFRSNDDVNLLERIRCSHSSSLGQAILLRNYYVITRLIKDNSEHTKNVCTLDKCIKNLRGIVKDCHFNEELFIKLNATPLPSVDLYDKNENVTHQMRYVANSVDTKVSLDDKHISNENDNNNDATVEKVFRRTKSGTETPFLTFIDDTCSGDDFFALIANDSEDCSGLTNNETIEEEVCTSSTSLRSSSNNQNSSVQDRFEEIVNANGNDYTYCDLSTSVAAYREHILIGKWTNWEFLKRSRFKMLTLPEKNDELAR